VLTLPGQPSDRCPPSVRRDLLSNTMSTEHERLEVRVISRARHDEVSGHRDGRLVVRVTAAPVDGQANAAVRRLVAEYLGVRSSRVEIVAGSHSRNKVLRIHR
jgi:uncharacterized protein (TIGR00251 family)